jgi:hypothetical protein
MDPQGRYGVNQGPRGNAQGRIGALAADVGGSSEGIARAASGGMAGKTPADAQRKSMGLFSFLQPIASIAAAVPGPWQPIAAGASALMGGIEQNNANAKAASAAGAAQGAEGNALLGRAGIAGDLTGTPDYSGILKAGQGVYNTFKANEGGVANPGALLKDMQGQSYEKAIEGTLSDWVGQQEAAANILGGNAGAYNNIGRQAGAAANASGNPFSNFMNILNGLKLGGASSPSPVMPNASTPVLPPAETPSLTPPSTSLSPNGLPGTKFGGGTGILNGGGMTTMFPGSAGGFPAGGNPNLTLQSAKPKTNTKTGLGS